MTSPATLSGPPAKPPWQEGWTGWLLPGSGPGDLIKSWLNSFSLRIEVYVWLGKWPGDEDIPIDIILKFMLDTIKYWLMLTWVLFVPHIWKKICLMLTPV